MRIVHVVDSMEIGGAETLVEQLCRFQRHHGHQPSVHCLFGRGELADKLEIHGTDVQLHAPRTGLQLIRSLRRSFKELKPDVVHCHNAAATIVGALSARFAGVPRVISTRHGLVAPPYSWRRELKFSFAARYCSAVVGVCDATTRNLKTAPWANPSRIVTICNGAEPAVATHWTGPVPHKIGFTLINVGRLAPPKDQVTLLRSVALAQKEVSDLALWIVGDGPLAASLKRLSETLDVASRTTFFGARTDVGSLLSLANVFVLSSNSEGLPVSLLEAMSAGLPMVVTDVGGMPEVARASKAGIVVPPSNPEALAQAICTYARIREQLPAIGAAARAYYERHHSLEQMYESYLGLYCTART